jgi:hypothetical protein
MAVNYNYDAFIPENFMPQMRFDKSPALGKPGPDFPLWKIEDRSETSLHAVCASNALTVVEFGSLT